MESALTISQIAVANRHRMRNHMLRPMRHAPIPKGTSKRPQRRQAEDHRNHSKQILERRDAEVHHHAILGAKGGSKGRVTDNKEH